MGENEEEKKLNVENEEKMQENVPAKEETKKAEVKNAESKVLAEKKEEPNFKKVETKTKKSKHGVAKAILILIGLLVVIYFIFVMRNYYIMNNIKEKASAYKDVTNYTYHVKTENMDSTITQKDNNIRLDCSSFGNNNEETIIWFDRNTKEGLFVLPNQKKATRINFSDVVAYAPFSMAIDAGMEIELDGRILYTWIYTDEFDGKECYVLSYDKYNKDWIEKDTGLLVKREVKELGTSEYTNISVNTIDEVYKPDLTGFEITDKTNTIEE